MYSASLSFNNGSRFCRSVAKSEDVDSMAALGVRVSGDVLMLARMARVVVDDRRSVKALRSSVDAVGYQSRCNSLKFCSGRA